MDESDSELSAEDAEERREDVDIEREESDEEEESLSSPPALPSSLLLSVFFSFFSFLCFFSFFCFPSLSEAALDGSVREGGDLFDVLYGSGGTG